MGKFIDTLQSEAGGAIGGLVSTGLGLLLEKHNDKRQIRQQQKLTDMQVAANKNLSDYNAEQQLKMWHNTNYGAQMKELKLAGLNPGLIYGLSGGGATTTGGGAQSASAGTAAAQSGEILGIMAMKNQNELTKAQIDNIKADTANKISENPNFGIKGKNIEADTALTKANTQIAEIQKTLAEGTMTDNMKIIDLTAKKLQQELFIIENQADISEETKQSQINEIKTNAVNAIINGALMKSNIQVNEQQIKKLANDITLNWAQWTQHQQWQEVNQVLMSSGAKLMDKQAEYILYNTIIQGVGTMLNGIGKLGKNTYNTNNYIPAK